MSPFSPSMVRTSNAVRRSATLAISSTRQASTRRPVDETTLAGAQHKVSLSGPSLGHLISELSATKPGMEALRQPGQTVPEEQRTTARRIAQWIIGVPIVFGTGVVGFNFFMRDSGEDS